MARRRRLPLALLTLAWVALACQTNDHIPVPEIEAPNPSLDTFEEPVATALREGRSRVMEAPRSAAAWGSLGLTLQAHELEQDAVVCYRQAGRLDPSDAAWPYLTALALRSAAPEEALDEFAQAETRRPSHATFYVRFGDTLLDNGNVRAAEQRYRQALQIDSSSLFGHFGLARVALLDGDLEAARQAARAALAEHAEFREAHSLLAQIEQRLGNSEAAQRHTWLASNFPAATAPDDPVFQRVSAAGRSSVWAVRRGLAAADQQRYAEASESFRQALSIRGDNATDLSYLGAALAGMGQTTEAMEIYGRALALDPTSVVTLNNLAQAHLQLNQLDQAYAHLKVALTQDPDNREALLNMALLRGRQGRLEASRSVLRGVLDASPGDVRALELMAPLLLQMGQADAALDHWDRLLTLRPQAMQALEEVVRLRVERREHAAAIETLRRGLSAAPNSSRLALFLAWELATAPDPELRDGREAVALAGRVRRAYPQQYQPADVLAAAHAENGAFDEALKEIEVALRLAAEAEAPVIPALEARRASYLNGVPFRQ